MAFTEYRHPFKNSSKREFDIERFAYDVFAYILRICGIPERNIPTSTQKENVYDEDSFIMNVGLSALPISLYMRDDWRLTFQNMFEEDGIKDILEIQTYLESFIGFSGEFEEEDTVSKIQYSLALYNELALFLYFKGTGIGFDTLPKLWSHLCKELVAQSETFDEETFEQSLTMCPDVSEPWISDFIKKFAIPYGSSSKVSERFSLYTLESHVEKDPLAEKTSNWVTDFVSKESTSDDSGEDTATFLREGSKSELRDIPSMSLPSQSSDEQQEIVDVEKKTQRRHKNGLTYVLHKCLKGQKRSRSDELDVQDAFGRINLEKENISPENHDSKRRRKISGKDTSG